MFKDLIDSKRIPRVNLTEVYRQQDGSSIVDLAHRMKVGEPIDITQRFTIAVSLTVLQTKYLM